VTERANPGSDASLGRVTGSITAVGLAESDVRMLGRRFLFSLYAAMRNLRIYPVDNPTVQKALEDLSSTARDLVSRDGEGEFRVAGEFLFLNSTRMRLDVDNYESFSFVIARLRESDIERLGFRQLPEPSEWALLLTCLLDPVGVSPRARFDAVRDALEVHGVQAFRLRPFDVITEALDDDAVQRARARRVYEQAVLAMVDVHWAVRHAHPANLKRLKRVVQGLVDQVLVSEAPLVALTSVRGYADEEVGHAVEVAILAVALGRRVGLSRLALYQLGFSALFHDIGLARLPASLYDDAEVAPSARWRMLRQHPWLGVLALLQLRDQADFAYRSMLVAYQHHMRRDLSGYPRARRLGELIYSARIVAVADTYVAVSNRRQASGAPVDPSQVLALMLANPTRALDPVLLKGLAQLLGTYPVGTAVLLASGEVGVVVRIHPLAEMADRPIVRIARDADGALQFPGREVNLAEVDEAGTFRHAIVGTFDADRHGIRAGDFVL
jgi:HD-GYP domain-containing protein (c-di-GMP phosphodiesterase class II)